MARDYAKKGERRREPIAGWIWLISGLIIGLFAAFIGFLAIQKPDALRQPPSPVKLWQETRDADRRELKQPPQPEEKAESPSRSGFDFYTILPEYEVAIPEEEVAPPTKGEPRPEPVASSGSYILQAGSFRNGKDAETRKAELALLGVVASVQTVTINGTDSWHRVRIGPIEAGEGLERVRRLLKENAIDYILLKQKI